MICCMFTGQVLLSKETYASRFIPKFELMCDKVLKFNIDVTFISRRSQGTYIIELLIHQNKAKMSGRSRKKCHCKANMTAKNRIRANLVT